LVAHPTNRKWVITPVINGISRVNPLITGVITHLLSGMSHQAGWGPQSSSRSVGLFLWLNSMVYGRYNELANGDYNGL